MKSSIRLRSALGLAVLMIAAPLTGCSGPETLDQSARAVDPSPPPTGAVGSAMAKGAELSAAATVQAWIAVRNRALTTGDTSAVDALTARACTTCGRYVRGGRWRVESARVTRQGSSSATVTTRVTADTRPWERLALDFEVGRVADAPRITAITRLP